MGSMPYDKQRVEDAVLALLQLTASDGLDGTMVAWKGYPWEVTDALHEKGLISDPRSKRKSIVVTAEGARRSRRLFAELFGSD